MGASRGVPQDLHQPVLDFVRDDMLPAVGLGVDLMPWQPDDVGQQPLGQAVLADDAGGELAAGRGQGEGAAPDLDVALFPETVHHLRNGGGGVADTLG